MKRITALLLVLILALTLCGCGHKHVWRQATATEPKTCTICGTTEGEALGYAWGEVSYEWAEDNGSVTATRVSGTDPSIVETETAVTTAEVTREATFEEPGETTYTAVFENPEFPSQTRTVADIPPRSYEWGEISFVWNEDGSLTATRVSGADPSISETETATVTAEVTKEPTFEEPGETTYTAVFKNPDFTMQIRTVPDIEPLSYEWGDVRFEWSEDNSSVTAVRTSGADPSISESETAAVTAEVTKEPTFEEPGETTYTARFDNPAFPVQVRTVADIAPRDYEWGEASYTWNEDGTITASRVSGADPSITESETVPVAIEVTKDATCEEPGETTYTAVFENDAFPPQTRVEADIAPLGHDWGEVSYEWSEDLGSVTASRVCAHDPDHVETETVTAAVEVTKDAGCEEPGETTYSVSFDNPAFAAQSRTEADVEPLGHSWKDATHTSPATCDDCGETQGEALPIHYLDQRFKDFRHRFNSEYAGFLNLVPVKGEGFVLKVQGATLSMNGMEGTLSFYHGDEFHSHDEASREELKHFNLLRLRYDDPSEDYQTSYAGRVAELGYYTAKILDPELSRDSFFKEGIDLFAAKDSEQRYVHNGFVYTLSCTPDEGGYLYCFTISLEDNLD